MARMLTIVSEISAFQMQEIGSRFLLRQVLTTKIGYSNHVLRPWAYPPSKHGSPSRYGGVAEHQ